MSSFAPFFCQFNAETEFEKSKHLKNLSLPEKTKQM